MIQSKYTVNDRLEKKKKLKNLKKKYNFNLVFKILNRISKK